jgi:hypothetical protein
MDQDKRNFRKFIDPDERNFWKERIVKEMMNRPGRSNAFGMGELYEAVFGEGYTERINGTRKLRTLICELQEEGYPIISVSSKDGGGYFIPSTEGEKLAYCERLKKQALKKLAKAARLKRVRLPELVGEIQLALEVE